MSDRPPKVSRFWTYVAVKSDQDNSPTLVGDPVPFDIVFLVMQHLDRADLKIFGLVNRDFHKQTARILWRNASIRTARTRLAPGKTRQTRLTGIVTVVSLDEQCDAIIQNPERAAYIRSLYILLDIKYRSQRVPMHKIRQALHSVHNLVSLRVSAINFLDVPTILNPNTPFPFDLKIFVIRDRDGDGKGLVPFFASQPSIAVYADQIAFTRSDWTFPSLPILPNLDTVATCPLNLHCIMKGRAISTLDIQNGAYNDSQSLQDMLTASTVPLTSLRMCQYHAPEKAFEDLAIVAKNAPQLRSLGVKQEEKIHFANKLGPVLQEFHNLEEFEWWSNLIYETTDNPSQELIDEFVQECLVACPTLCKVIYTWEFFLDMGRFAHMRVFEAPHPGWVPPDRPAGSTGLDLCALGWTVRVGLRESIGYFVASGAVASAAPWGFEYTETLSARAKIGDDITDHVLFYLGVADIYRLDPDAEA